MTTVLAIATRLWRRFQSGPFFWPVVVASLGALLILVFGPNRPKLPVTKPDAPIVKLADEYVARSDSLERELAVVRGEARGWKGKAETALARIRGLEERPLETMTIYKTVIQPETVFVAVAQRASGQVEVTAGVRDSARLPDSPPGYVPRVLSGASLADCDKGWVITGSTVICHRPPLGHLGVFFDLGVSSPVEGIGSALPSGEGAVGLHWQKSYRSTFGAAVRMTIKGRIEAGFRTGMWIF